VKKYIPDFLIRFASGTMLVLEIKGQDAQQNRTKRGFLDEWTKSINTHGGFGTGGGTCPSTQLTSPTSCAGRREAAVERQLVLLH
jgi:hypothetical protein